MRLTTQTDYALRMLMHAALKGPELDRLDAVAGDFGISRHHLTKVLHKLSQRGYLQTVRGRSGGFRLARDAAEISVGQVVRDFEPDFKLAECFATGSQCCIQESCVLAGELDSALEAFLRHLEPVTLHDLIRPRRRLIEHLGIKLQPPSGGLR